jgi:hypothetical protein
VSGWSAEELDRIGTAEQLHLASRRADGTLNRKATSRPAAHGTQLMAAPK